MKDEHYTLVCRTFKLPINKIALDEGYYDDFDPQTARLDKKAKVIRMRRHDGMMLIPIFAYYKPRTANDAKEIVEFIKTTEVLFI